MATETIKRNGVEKKATQKVTKVVTPKKQQEKKPISSVTKTLAEQAIGKLPISLDDRILKFEKLKGLTNQRERLVTTLNDLNKFKYNQGHSSRFMLRDENGEEFTTSNSNLIQLVTKQVLDTLQIRKVEIEKSIVEFEL